MFKRLIKLGCAAVHWPLVGTMSVMDETLAEKRHLLETRC